LRVVFLSDVHFGHANHHARAFATSLKYIKEHPGVRWIGLGDLVENVTPNKDGGFHEDQKITPGKQVRGIIRVLKPIASQCLGLVAGNHELRTLKTAGLEPTALIAEGLGVTERYLGHGGLFLLRVGPHTYAVSMHHGSRYSGTNPFAEHERRLRIRPSADLYVLGHTHFLGAVENVKLELDSTTFTECAAPFFFLRTGSYLKYPPYADMAAHFPGRLGSPIVTFSGGAERRIEIDDRKLAAI
jgi:hypothetical protein